MDSMDSPRMLKTNDVPVSIDTLQQYTNVKDSLDANEYTSLQNTFKVSHLVKPKHYKSSNRTLKLQKPKN